jgi:lipopolysaccharide biosynthesis regulator YciM
MDLDLTWLLWGLPVAFVLGWLASRFDLRQWRIERQQAPKAYFRGLNHLLNEQQDQAIDAFIEAVQTDPDTVELHFALGNLFRRRGDYDRAVRVHEHLLSRADLGAKDRERAQHALAQDFLKAGLLDRAEAALQKLEESDYATEALMALLAIYERTRDWPQARRVAQKLDALQPGAYAKRLAHYLCEDAEQAQRGGDLPQARELFREACRQAPAVARGWIGQAAVAKQSGQDREALDVLMLGVEAAPTCLPLVADKLVQLATATEQTDAVRRVLEASDARAPSLDVTEALAHLAPNAAEANGRYVAHLRREPSLVMAGRWLATAPLEADVREPVLAAVDQASGALKRYRCAACGFEARQYFWQCPGCQGWDTYPTRRVEEL